MSDLALCELTRAIEGRLVFGSMPPIAGDDTPVGTIVTDSRRVMPGDVFWAIPGCRHNGADFAEEALARGASGVVLSGRHVEPWAGRWCLHVADPRMALARAAAAVRNNFAGTVVGVTGSVGKTTTRQMIHTVLSSRYSGTASPYNYNNDVGVPLSMLAWNRQQEYAVLELAANHSGEIAALSNLARPSIGVITCIGEAHLGGFGDRESIAAAKMELVDALPGDGRAVLNGDDAMLRRAARTAKCDVTWVGRGADCELVATDVIASGGRLSFRAAGANFQVPVWGRHHLTSVLCAVAVGRLFDITPNEAAEALCEFAPPPQRCHVTRIGGITIIDDTYNANPTSMRAALELLRDFDAPGRRVILSGDMLELGEEADALHRSLGQQMVTICGADLVVACGEHAATVATAARDAGLPSCQTMACADAEAAFDSIRQRIAPGDVLLVKGSRGMALERIVAALGIALGATSPARITLPSAVSEWTTEQTN